MRIFRHYVEPALLALGLIELASFLACFYIGYFARYADLQMISSELRAHALPALVYASVMSASFLATGLYERAAVGDMRTVAIRVLAAFVLGFVVLAVLVYVFRGLDIWRSALVIAIPASAALALGVRRIFLWLVGRDAFRRRILVLGDVEGVARLRALEGALGLAPFRVVYTILSSEALGGANDEEHLLALCRAERIDEIVVATRERRGCLPVRALLRCRLAGVPVSEYETFFERQTGRVDLDWIRPGWLIFGEGFTQGSLDAFAKRLIDVSCAAVGLVFFAPLLLLAALLIKLEDGGPVLFRQIRVGRNGVPFSMLKLRSMRIDAERDGPRWAARDDRRITRIGRILRRTRIDELPQLINVLRGEMSFVGPRPERPEFVALIARELPLFSERHRVRPGLAGWAQLHHPYAASVEDTRTKLEYDIYYVKNWSLFLDLLILAQTLRVVVWGNGAR
ncbi:MAG: TIGR03013 family PEP-CTERM/XrtA system glycosyltransferase [Geminicoccaceae bacterium]|nr:TIGR03013 family PEP-CTERM/XrtA system glycosyltransferase [Geminicoccaceae bacterium]